MHIPTFIRSLTAEEKQDLLCALIRDVNPSDVDLNKIDKAKLTPMKDWVTKQTNISGRLENILLGLGSRSFRIGKPPFEYVEEVCRSDFFKLLNAGKSSWDEFVKLRGF